MNGLPDKPAPSLATALKQEQEQAAVLAQGHGAAAERIVATAAMHDIPVLQDFALSQALRKVPPGTRIPDPLFKALAGVLDYLLLQDKTLPARQQDETQ
jgi:flagellar biosynthesis protein